MISIIIITSKLVFSLSLSLTHSNYVMCSNWFYSLFNSGIISMLSLICFYLQFISLVLLPTLMWSKMTKRTLSVFSVIRTWHLEPLFNGYSYFMGTESSLIDNDYNWSSSTGYGDLMNFYFPIVSSLIISGTFVSLLVGLFVLHYLKKRKSELYQKNSILRFV
jgi:hypothetical protein